MAGVPWPLPGRWGKLERKSEASGDRGQKQQLHQGPRGARRAWWPFPEPGCEPPASNLGLSIWESAFLLSSPRGGLGGLQGSDQNEM